MTLRAGTGKTTSLFRSLMIIGLFIYLSACGFHLRGQSSLPPELESIQLLGENLSAKQRSLLEQKLRQAGARLRAADSQVTDGSDQVRLKVLFSSLKSRQLVNAAGSGKTIVRLSRQLIYSLEKTSGEQAVERGTLEQQLDIDMDENNLLDSDESIRRAEESIDRALVDLLIFGLRQL